MFDFMVYEGFHTASRLPGSHFQCSALHLSSLSSVWVGEEKKTENEIHNVFLIFCKNAEVKQTSLIDLSVFFLGICNCIIWSILPKEKTESFSLSLADNFLSGSHTFFSFLFLSTHLHRRTHFFFFAYDLASLLWETDFCTLQVTVILLTWAVWENLSEITSSLRHLSKVFSDDKNIFIFYCHIFIIQYTSWRKETLSYGTSSQRGKQATLAHMTSL